MAGLLCLAALLCAPATGAPEDRDPVDDAVRVFHEVVSTGDVAAVAAMIDVGVDVNEWSDRSASPLHIAAVRLHLPLVELLAEAGADVGAGDRNDGATPLHWAVEHSEFDEDEVAKTAAVVQALVAAGSDPDARDHSGLAPLHWTAREGRPETVGLLVELGADVNARSPFGTTPLHLAAKRGWSAMMDALLEAGADPNALASNGLSPLHLATERSSVRRSVRGKSGGYLSVPETILYLLERGAATDPPPKPGLPSPLMVAIKEGDVGSDAVRALLEAGADPDSKGGMPYSPLHVAARFGKLGAAVALLAAGAKVDALDDKGLTPLHAASRAYGDEHFITSALIEAGADVNARSLDGKTPLHSAAIFADERIAAELLTAGADANATDDSGATPLAIAAVRGHNTGRNVAEVLLSHGADPNLRFQDVSPLIVAASAGNEEVAVLLMSGGARIEREDDAGAALFALADSRGLRELAVRIMERAAVVHGVIHEPSAPLALLKVAALADASNVMPLLLEHRGSEQVADEHTDETLLSVAAAHGSVGIARLLVERGAAATSGGELWLHDAAGQGSAEVAGILLEAGASVGETSKWGVTALHWAAIHDSTDVAALLIDRGADVNAADALGWTPLHMALFKNATAFSPETARLLLEHGALADAETLLAGWRPLHIAAHLGNRAIVELLLESEADVNARMKLGGRTPLHLARRSGTDGVVAALEAAGGEDASGEAFPAVYWDGHRWNDTLYAAPWALAITASRTVRVVEGSFTRSGRKPALGHRLGGRGPSIRGCRLPARARRCGWTRAAPMALRPPLRLREACPGRGRLGPARLRSVRDRHVLSAPHRHHVVRPRRGSIRGGGIEYGLAVGALGLNQIRPGLDGCGPETAGFRSSQPRRPQPVSSYVP